MSLPCRFAGPPFRRVSPLALLGSLAALFILTGCDETQPVTGQAATPPSAAAPAPPQQFNSEAERQAALARQVAALNALEGDWERRKQQQEALERATRAAEPQEPQKPVPTVVEGWDGTARPHVPQETYSPGGYAPLPHTSTDSAYPATSPDYYPPATTYTPPASAPSSSVEYGRVYQGRSGISYAYPKDGARTRRSTGAYGYGSPYSSGGSTYGGAGYAGTNANEARLQVVHITRTGGKYHSAGCQYLRKSDIPIRLGDAVSQGYSACSRCW